MNIINNSYTTFIETIERDEDIGFNLTNLVRTYDDGFEFEAVCYGDTSASEVTDLTFHNAEYDDVAGSVSFYAEFSGDLEYLSQHVTLFIEDIHEVAIQELIETRKLAGLTQDEAGGLIGLNKGIWQQYESDRLRITKDDFELFKFKSKELQEHLEQARYNLLHAMCDAYSISIGSKEGPISRTLSSYNSAVIVHNEDSLRPNHLPPAKGTLLVTTFEVIEFNLHTRSALIKQTEICDGNIDEDTYWSSLDVFRSYTGPAFSQLKQQWQSTLN